MKRKAQVSVPKRENGNKVRGRILRWLLRAVVSIVCSCVVLLWLALKPSTIQQVDADSSVAPATILKIDEAKSSAQRGTSKVVSLNETELNSLIEAKLKLLHSQPFANPNHLRDIQLRIINDRIGIHVSVEKWGQNTTLDIEGALTTRHGYVAFEPTSGKIGELPIPQVALREAVKRALSSPSSLGQLRLPDELADLRVEAGQLLATYR